MAMLTVALVAALAAGIVAAFGFAVDSLSGRHDLAQARWLARGAVDWARNVLADDRRTSYADHFGEPWAVKIPPTPVEEGEVSGEIEDLSGRFNLNSLVGADGSYNATTAEAFARLLEFAAVPPNQARLLARNLGYWIDTEVQAPGLFVPQLATGGPRPPNAPLVTPDELLNVPGFDAGLVARLQPYVTALPQDARLNLNTAPAEVLAAHFTVLSLDGARAVVADRNVRYYKELSDIKLGPGSRVEPDASLHDVKSTYFLVAGRAKFGSATTRMQVLIHRQAIGAQGSDAWPTILWQKIL